MNHLLKSSLSPPIVIIFASPTLLLSNPNSLFMKFGIADLLCCVGFKVPAAPAIVVVVLSALLFSRFAVLASSLSKPFDFATR